jgi:T-complex protein 1 subunit delta
MKDNRDTSLNAPTRVLTVPSPASTSSSCHSLQGRRLNILVVKDVERDEIDFITKSMGCKPVVDIEAFSEDNLGYADLVEETNNDGTKVVRITGVKNRGRTVSILAMSSNQLVLDECERSIHDALCVVRCLVKKRCAG